MSKFPCLLSIGIVFLLTSCGAAKSFEPDYSNPGGALQTFFYAMQNKRPGDMLEALSSESRKLYGTDKESQLLTIKKSLSSARLSQSSSIEIITVDMKDENYATIRYNQLMKGKRFISNLKIDTIREDGNWKIILTAPSQSQDYS